MDDNSHQSGSPDARAILEATVHVPKHVVYRAFDAETVLLNLKTGQYHGLNRTGGRMLELLEETAGDVREAVGRLAAEYGEQPDAIEDGLATFCAGLVERGLIEVDAHDGD